MEEFEVLFNGMRILQTDELFRLGTDSILLADFCTPPRGSRIADLGCGCGALGVLLCASDPECRITGLEIQEQACEITKKNIEINNLADRFSVVNGDLRRIRELLGANQYNCVVANPPYFPVGGGGLPQTEASCIARTELCCTLEDLCSAVCWLLRFGGSFFLVYRVERAIDLICTLRAHRLEPKRMRLVRQQPDTPASLFLMECRLGGKSGLKLENDLILSTSEGKPTPEYQRIYHMQ